MCNLAAFGERDVYFVYFSLRYPGVRAWIIFTYAGPFVWFRFYSQLVWTRRHYKLCRVIRSRSLVLYLTFFFCAHFVQAITNQKAQQNRAKIKGKEPYSCPVYTVPKRNDLVYIFNFSLPTKVDPMHWVLRGVAMLCSKEWCACFGFTIETLTKCF